jgi:hypothetical protein
MLQFTSLAAPSATPVAVPAVGFVTSGDITRPITTPHCVGCGKALHDGAVLGSIARVHGDSRYGYEATHVGCDWDPDLMGNPPR